MPLDGVTGRLREGGQAKVRHVATLELGGTLNQALRLRINTEAKSRSTGAAFFGPSAVRACLRACHRNHCTSIGRTRQSQRNWPAHEAHPTCDAAHWMDRSTKA